jgi:rhodanese-related sulfurtransferase
MARERRNARSQGRESGPRSLHGLPAGVAAREQRRQSRHRTRFLDGTLHLGRQAYLDRRAYKAIDPLLYCAPEKPKVVQSRMQRLLEYMVHHPLLVAAAALAAIVVAAYEIKLRMDSFAALPAMQAVRMMNQGALVLDLRGKDLYDAGHIGDARNVPSAQLESQAESLKKWRDKTVIAYCDSGREGAQAVRTLAKLGFTKVFNLEGGLNGWIKDNLPLAKSLPGGRSAAK